MSTPARSSPLFTRRLALFMGTMVLANVAGQMHQPLLPLYLQELGADIGQVGLFFTLGAIAPLFFQVFGGWLSDAIGRLQAIAIGSLAGIAAYVVSTTAPSWQWLLLSTVGGAMSYSFVAPSYMAFIAEESSEEARGRVYGLSQSLFMIVGVVGPPIGGYISQYWSFRRMLMVAAVLYTVATVIRLVMARDAMRSEAGSREKPTLSNLKVSLAAMAGLVVAGGVVTWVFISDGVRDVSYRLAFELLPIYLQNLMDLSNVQIAWLTSIEALVTMAVLTPAGWLSDRRGERVGLVAGFSIMAAAIAIFLRSRTFSAFAVVWALYGVGDALVNPAYNSLISKVVPLRLRGTAFGLFSTSIGLISLPAPWIGAALWERYAPQVPFYLPLIGSLLLLPIMWFKFKAPLMSRDASCGSPDPPHAGGSAAADQRSDS